MSCVTPLGKNFWKILPHFLLTSPMCFFSLLIMLCILSVLINPSHEDNYVRSSVSPPSKSLKLDMVLGTLDVGDISSR